MKQGRFNVRMQMQVVSWEMNTNDTLPPTAASKSFALTAVAASSAAGSMLRFSFGCKSNPVSRVLKRNTAPVPMSSWTHKEKQCVSPRPPFLPCPVSPSTLRA